MTKFSLSSAVTVSAYTVVEADSLEEAIAISEERDVVIGGPITGNSEKDVWIIDDADGCPTDIHGDK